MTTAILLVHLRDLRCLMCKFLPIYNLKQCIQIVLNFLMFCLNIDIEDDGGSTLSERGFRQGTSESGKVYVVGVCTF